MKLPLINQVVSRRKLIGQFGGLDELDLINENEFSCMKNLSSCHYPAAGTRPARGKIQKTLQAPHGLYYKNGLVYVDGTKLVYKEKEIATVTDGEKQIVGMGAYIVVWPDKVVYNTQTDVLIQVEQSWQQAGAATIGPVIAGSTFIKITCAGIGTKFEKYDAIEISGCTVNTELNKTTVIQDRADDYIVIIGTVEKSVTQASGLSVRRTAPDMDFLTESENRIWGCSNKNHEIYACKLGDPTNWNAFEGISTDSYAATVGSDGDFTGAITHLGYVLFFKEDTIHKVYGSKPSNIQITTMPLRGVAKGCEKSLCIVNETLYYAARNNVCAYEGSMPYSISDMLKQKYQEAAAGQYGNKYYVSLRTASDWQLYVYDPALQMWHAEDDTQLQYAVYGEGKLYYVDQINQLRTIADPGEDERIEWYLESGDLMESDLNKKKIRKLQLMVELGENSFMEVLVKTEREKIWSRIQTIRPTEKRVYTIPLAPNRCSHYRYRLQGAGEFKLLGIGKVLQDGSNR